MTMWHGSRNDLAWYDLYKDSPVRVKVTNRSGLGGQPSGAFKVREFTKTGTSKATLTIKHLGEIMTGSIDLDDPMTYIDRNCDKQYVYNFYIGAMPATPRQAFNLFQIQHTPELKNE